MCRPKLLSAYTGMGCAYYQNRGPAEALGRLIKHNISDYTEGVDRIARAEDLEETVHQVLNVLKSSNGVDDETVQEYWHKALYSQHYRDPLIRDTGGDADLGAFIYVYSKYEKDCGILSPDPEAWAAKYWEEVADHIGKECGIYRRFIKRAIDRHPDHDERQAIRMEIINAVEWELACGVDTNKYSDYMAHHRQQIKEIYDCYRNEVRNLEEIINKINYIVNNCYIGAEHQR